MQTHPSGQTHFRSKRGLTLLELLVTVAIGAVALSFALGLFRIYRNRLVGSGEQTPALTTGSSGGLKPGYASRPEIDTSGFKSTGPFIPHWRPEATLDEIRTLWQSPGYRAIESVDRQLAQDNQPELTRISLIAKKVLFLNFEGQAEKSYKLLEQIESMVRRDETLAQGCMAAVIYLQGVTALRRGENDNCIMCRGESSCILPISPVGRAHQSHRFPAGDQALHRVPRAVSRRPRGPLAA